MRSGNIDENSNLNFHQKMEVLPTELLHLIIAFTDFQTCGRLATVNKYFNSQCRDEQLYKMLASAFVRETGLDIQLENMKRKYHTWLKVCEYIQSHYICVRCFYHDKYRGEVKLLIADEFTSKFTLLATPVRELINEKRSQIMLFLDKNDFLLGDITFKDYNWDTIWFTNHILTPQLLLVRKVYVFTLSNDIIEHIDDYAFSVHFDHEDFDYLTEDEIKEAMKDREQYRKDIINMFF